MSPITIVFPLYQGITQLDFTGPHQVFSRLPGAKVIAASMAGQDIEADGLVFSALADLASLETCDVLCVPGGSGTSEAMLCDAYMAQVRRLGLGARFITSVCTGSLILAAAGFLRGRQAATHWAWRDLLTPFDVTICRDRVVRDGDIFTGGGVTAGIDLGLAVAAEVAGQEMAQAIQLTLEYAPDPPFNAGRPELAPASVLAQVQARMAPVVEARRGAAVQAARRLQAV